MDYAAKRGVIDRGALPAKVKLPKDAAKPRVFHTVEQFKAVRLALAPGRWRWVADWFFWTGHHNSDAWSAAWWMLEPDYEWRADDGALVARGRYWRRNHKNPRCEAAWLPMEPEFREAVLDLFAENPHRSPRGLITGRVWSVQQAFRAACDRAEVPRVSPIRLRASFATMLSARGYPREYVRLAMGHEGVDSIIQGGNRTRPAILERHYLGLDASPELLVGALRARHVSGS
jgi:integrase